MQNWKQICAETERIYGRGEEKKDREKAEKMHQ